MPYNLVIVESPAKCDKIEKILGPGYKCVASYGHLQQLSTLKDIDIMNNFKPSFRPIETKKSQINKLKGLITHCEEVILATDDEEKEKELLGIFVLYLIYLLKILKELSFMR